jgi:hypothetical protein
VAARVAAAGAVGTGAVTGAVVAGGSAVRVGVSVGNHWGKNIGPPTNQITRTTAESTVARMMFLV